MPDITATRPAAGAPIESSWGGQVHDLVEGVQTGTVALAPGTGDQSATVVVTFPRPYVTQPVVVAIAQGGGAHTINVGVVGATGGTSVTLQARRVDGTTFSASTAAWIAVGTPA